MKNIFIICSVRDASPEYREKLESYVQKLESEGNKVHLPHRDTNQSGGSLEICKQNYNAIRLSDEIHIFYSSKSQGTHFDMGVSFGLNKKIVVVENEPYGEGKSFPKMLVEWSETELNKDVFTKEEVLNLLQKQKEHTISTLGLSSKPFVFPKDYNEIRDWMMKSGLVL